MEAQLGGLADHLNGLTRILDIRKLDDDPPVTGAGERRFGHPECIDASAQHFQRPISRLGICLDAFGVLGLQDDLGAALQIQPETGRGGEDEGSAYAYCCQREDGAPESGARRSSCGHQVTPMKVAARDQMGMA